jgi:hypothetical protein
MPFERQIENLRKGLENDFSKYRSLEEGKMLLLKIWADHFEILLQQCELLVLINP